MTRPMAKTVIGPRQGDRKLGTQRYQISIVSSIMTK